MMWIAVSRVGRRQQHSWRRGRIVTVAVLACVSGCASWRSVPRKGSTDLPERVRISTVAGDRLTVADAHLEGDSVIVGRDVNSGREVRLSVREIERVQGRVSNPSGTVTLLAVTALVVVPVIFFAFFFGLA